MIEIIPNWHPIFVHFTVALLFVAILLLIAAQFISVGNLREQCQLVALWNLWLGAGITVLTVIAGVLAYNSVSHDTPSHEAMTDHRNWALVTAAFFIVASIWTWLRKKETLVISKTLLVIMIVGGVLLASTAWRGGELVYRYGLGVMSLPKADSHGHAAGVEHDHGSQVQKDVHDNSDGHHDVKKATDHHDNSDGHHDVKKADHPHDNSDGHHDKPVHDNSDGHHDVKTTK